jgi:hypothetical protein
MALLFAAQGALHYPRQRRRSKGERMGHQTALVLWALLALEVKHFLCDFVFQTEYQIRTKGIYGHVGGFLHSGYHMIGSLPALLIMHAPLRAIVIVMAGEFLVHYHTDWTKSNVDSHFDWGQSDARYWMVFGTDQLIHQLTYLAIVTLLTLGTLN